MNNGTLELSQSSTQSRSRSSRPAVDEDAMSRAKRELLQAEVRLAKARATIVTAEIDIKVLNARLKELAK